MSIGKMKLNDVLKSLQQTPTYEGMKYDDIKATVAEKSGKGIGPLRDELSRLSKKSSPRKEEVIKTSPRKLSSYKQDVVKTTPRQSKEVVELQGLPNDVI